jgi:hypothetical protein
MNEPPIEHILQIGLGFWPAKTLLSAVELGLFTELAKHAQSLESLQLNLALHPRSARDFLDALVALGFLERRDGRYSNTPAADFYLDKAKPSYVGGVLEVANQRLYPFWSHLTAALHSGEPQNEAKSGGPSFSNALYGNLERLRGFLKAMTGLSRAANRVIAGNSLWKNYKTVADAGTAQGDLLVQVALANPHVSGIGFDLPQVAPIFEEYTAYHGLSSRVKFHPGSFFKDELPKADVVVMGHILHDWNVQEKKLLLRKAFEAIPLGGALIVYESIIDDDRRANAFGLLMSLNMLIETPGGFEYTAADCMRWMKGVGFREARVERLVGPDSMVVGIK